MAEFIRGTTPVFEITLEGTDYDQLGTVLFRFRQNGTVLDKTPVISDNKATITLTQEETLRFDEGKVSIQLMGILGPAATEVVPKSDIVEISVLRSLWEEAVHNG